MWNEDHGGFVCGKCETTTGGKPLTCVDGI